MGMALWILIDEVQLMAWSEPGSDGIVEFGLDAGA